MSYCIKHEAGTWHTKPENCPMCQLEAENIEQDYLFRLYAEFSKSKIIKLEAQVAELQAKLDSVTEWQAPSRNLYDEQQAENTKLNVVINAAKKAVSQHGVVYPIPSSGQWAMTELKQALAALEADDEDN